jgi:hypothetical protein
MTTLQDQPRTQANTSSPFGNQHAQEAEELHQRQMQQQQGAREQNSKAERNQSADDNDTFTVSTDDWFK